MFDDTFAVRWNGGAVLAQGGEGTISRGIFTNSSAVGLGGALFAINTSLTIYNGTRFEGNGAVQ